MESGHPTDVRALIRAARETKMDIVAVADDDEESASESGTALSRDPRFLAPGRRRSVPEDSGTYSVVFRRDDD